MRHRLLLGAISLSIAWIAAPARACQSYVGPMNLDYGTRAEVIVVGRITDYEKVRSETGLHPGAIIPLSVYSRIYVTVEQVLSGEASRTISAIVDKWPDGGLLSAPAKSERWPDGRLKAPPAGQVLIALEDLSVSDVMRPRHGRDGVIIPNPRWGVMTVVEEPCRSAFIFDAASKEAQAFLAVWRRARRLDHSLNGSRKGPLGFKPDDSFQEGKIWTPMTEMSWLGDFRICCQFADSRRPFKFRRDGRQKATTVP